MIRRVNYLFLGTLYNFLGNFCLGLLILKVGMLRDRAYEDTTKEYEVAYEKWLTRNGVCWCVGMKGGSGVAESECMEEVIIWL